MRSAPLICMASLLWSGWAFASTSAETPKSRFDSSPAFKQPLTVHRAGDPLEDVVGDIGRALGVTLKCATPEIGDQRVVVFADQLPANEILGALTAMLNQTAESGYSWQEQHVGKRLVMTLFLDLKARRQAGERLEALQKQTESDFVTRLDGLRHDDETRAHADDPAVMPGLGRGQSLASTLTDEQVGQLLQTGVLSLRYSDASEEQQRVMSHMGPDLQAGVAGLLRSNPDLSPLYQDFNTQDFTVVFSLQRNAAQIGLKAEFRAGPGKGGVRQDIPLPPKGAGRASSGGTPRPAPGTGTARASTGSAGTGSAPPSGGSNGGGPAAAPGSSSPADDDTEITLQPASWSMGNVLADLAYRSRQPLVSDCYTQSWTPLASLGTVPLKSALRRISELYGVDVRRVGRFRSLRSRVYYSRQAREVPERLLARWLDRIRDRGSLDVDCLSELATLSDSQLDDLTQHEDLQRLAPGVNAVVGAIKWPLLIYAGSPRSRKAAATRAGMVLKVAEMTPQQRALFFRWVAERMPRVPAARYAEGELMLLQTPEPRLKLGCRFGELTETADTWLSLDRDWHTGQPRSEAGARSGPPRPDPATLLIASLDGTRHKLPLTKGRPAIVYFRPLSVFPRVQLKPADPDLKKLEEFVAKHPEWAAQVAVVCVRDRARDVSDWVKRAGLSIPTFVDEGGRTPVAYTGGSLPTAVVVDADGRVKRVIEGLPSVEMASWETIASEASAR